MTDSSVLLVDFSHAHEWERYRCWQDGPTIVTWSRCTGCALWKREQVGTASDITAQPVGGPDIGSTAPSEEASDGRL